MAPEARNRRLTTNKIKTKGKKKPNAKPAKAPADETKKNQSIRAAVLRCEAPLSALTETSACACKTCTLKRSKVRAEL